MCLPVWYTSIAESPVINAVRGGSHLSLVTMIGFDEFGWDA
jgi:hypothetical protein